MSNDFSIDSKNKLGVGVEWEDGNEFDDFVRNLNAGSTVRPVRDAGDSELPRENQLTEDAVRELRNVFANYR